MPSNTLSESLQLSYLVVILILFYIGWPRYVLLWTQSLSLAAMKIALFSLFSTALTRSARQASDFSLESNSLRLIFREFREAVMDFPWMDAKSYIKGSLRTWRGFSSSACGQCIIPQSLRF